MSSALKCLLSSDSVVNKIHSPGRLHPVYGNVIPTSYQRPRHKRRLGIYLVTTCRSKRSYARSGDVSQSRVRHRRRPNQMSGPLETLLEMEQRHRVNRRRSSSGRRRPAGSTAVTSTLRSGRETHLPEPAFRPRRGAPLGFSSERLSFLVRFQTE